MKYLIVGLGNVGLEYELTRHNIGFSIIDQIAEKFEVKFNIDKHAEYCSFKYKTRNIHLLKPSNFVNNSGKAVNYWLNKLKIKNENLIVLLDDLSLPFGKIRIKKSGSDGGHNGLKSINQELDYGDIVQFIFYINMLTWPFASVGWVSSLVQRAAASQKRINVFLLKEEKVINEGKSSIKNISSLVFKNVQFNYSTKGDFLINDLSFTLKSGESLGIFGATGSGKSTLANLICRLYEISNGEYLINNHNINQY